MSGLKSIIFLAALAVGSRASGVGHAHFLPSVTSFPVVRYAPYYNFPHAVRSIHAVAPAAVAPAVPAFAHAFPRFAAPVPVAPPIFAPAPVPAFAPAPVFGPAPAPVFSPPPTPVFGPAPAAVFAPAPPPVFAPAPPPVFAPAPSPVFAPAPPPVFAPAPAPVFAAPSLPVYPGPAFAPAVPFARAVPYSIAPHSNHIHVFNKFLGPAPPAFPSPILKQFAW